MYDIIGNIAILKSQKSKISDDYQKSKRFLKEADKKLARQILKERKQVKSVYVKAEKVSGKLRTIKVRWLAGEKNKQAVYKENNCRFKLNVEKCYFSSRLASERAEIAKMIKKNDKVLVLFGGVAPFAIVIAKKTGARVVSVELGRACSKYARENVLLNKLNEKVEIVQGDVRKLKKLVKGKFDVIVMPRPQIKESFLKYITGFCRKNTRIYYYDFGRQEELGKILEKIKNDFKLKYKIVCIKKVGEIAPYKFRWRVELVVK